MRVDHLDLDLDAWLSLICEFGPSTLSFLKIPGVWSNQVALQ